MASTEFFQSPAPQGAPPPVTPQASPADPAGWAMVTPHGQGPAPYDIQAPMDDLMGAYQSAGALNGAGIVYGQGPRQAEAEALLESPPGYGEFDILQGFSGQDATTHGWPNDVRPAADPDNGGYGGA
jgi:hypothetical protein